MEIKHIHPAYESGEQRLDRLQEVRKICLELVLEQRAGTVKRSAGKTRDHEV